MPSLLSGSVLRKGGSGEFIALPDAMPQLPPTPTTSTGFSLITNDLLQTTYVSSLGNIEFNKSQMYSSLSTGTITILSTGTASVALNTASGTLVVTGGVGIGANLWVKDDIHVNDLTIGQGYKGNNNIVFRGTATAVTYEFDNGQENIAIGYDVLGGLTTAYRNIAIGRNALSTGTHVINSIAIGDGALKKSGAIVDIPVANITGATQANPVVITAPSHGLASATYVNIRNVTGMIELTTQSFYINVLSGSTFSLYTDILLSQPVNGTGYTGYSGPSGTVNRILLKDNNIAIGVDAGRNLIDGTGNFFFGNQLAKSITTGSYNFFAGKGGVNLTHGSNIISINGSLIVDGVDNQINLGSIFYYDGTGDATINADTEIGLGSPSTSSNTGALTVIGGAGISDDVHIGGITTSTSITSGALVVAGGAGISGNVNIGKELNVTGSGKVDLSPAAYNVYIEPTIGGSVVILPAAKGSIDNMTIGLNTSAAARFDTVNIISTTSSTSTITGALVVAGGAGIGGDIYNKNGASDENNLLYTPRVFVSTSTPATPRIGDVWVDATNLAYLQYIKDGTSTFWLQVGAV